MSFSGRSRLAEDLVVDREPPAPGRVELEEAQAEIRRQTDVLGLADVETLGPEGVEALLHNTWSIATGSVANRRALFSQVHSGLEAPGPP